MTPVYNTGKRVLEECIASVLDQTESDWELCLVDDCSTDPGVRKVLQRAAALDRRIRVHFRSSNGGIVAASNDGLGMALGRYVGLLDHDDVLEPDALEEVFAALTVKPDIDYLYTDEDLLGEDGKTREAFRKPDWSPERFRNQMYVCHFSVIKRELLEAVGGFRPGFDGSQDYDLMLRVTESANVIHHIPKVLYHWRIVEGSVAGDPDAKPYAYTAGENALHDHCERVGIKAIVSSSRSLPGNYTIKRQASATQTPVDLFFVTRTHN
ncbi:MAG: glycosyltransferase [Ilumatobacteraceae bacterium]|nr:glycosyltransferase [Ilumatobacteraceae bacterium]